MCLWYIVERENAVSEFEEQVGTEGYEGPEWQLRRNQHFESKEGIERKLCGTSTAGYWGVGRDWRSFPLGRMEAVNFGRHNVRLVLCRLKLDLEVG